LKRFKYSVFEDCVARFPEKRLMVIGDLLLDQYIWGEVSRISPEAPVPVVWVKRENFLPGGASNVANNLARYGAKVIMVGVVGDDERGETLKDKLGDNGVITDGIFTDGERPTSLKTRVIAHSQQVVRIDREEVESVKGPLLEKLLDFVKEKMDDIDGIVIEDYGKGLITPALLGPVVRLARKKGKVISVDPKESHFKYYTGVTTLTPNHHEAAKAVGFSLVTDDDIERAGEKMVTQLKADNVLITLGEKGMILFERSHKFHRIPTVAQEVFDVTGAGDTVIATYTLALLCGKSSLVAAHLANCAAGIVVGKVGVATVEPAELLSKVKTLMGRRNI